MTFTHLMRSKHPEIGYIMAEQCDDIDSILVAPLLWDAMPQTTWDPGFEPMSNALMDLVNPSGETVAAMIGGMGQFQVIPPLPSLFTRFGPYLAHFLPVFPRCFARFHRLAEAVPTSPKPEPRAKKRRHEDQEGRTPPFVRHHRC